MLICLSIFFSFSQQPYVLFFCYSASFVVFVHSQRSIIPGWLRGAQLVRSSRHFLQRAIAMPTEGVVE
ncbi:hypothetical protein JOQ06_013159, partial [Pogonophryne albipinna]